MPNVLLINPSISARTLPKAITGVMRYSFPFSLGYLAGFLRSKGIPSLIIDDQLHYLDESRLRGILSGLDIPRIVGITTLTPTCSRAYELASTIKSIDPRTIVVLGGIHATVLPEEALSRHGVDAVVRGEGEETFWELAENVLSGRGFRSVRGISYRDGDQIRHNPDRPLIADLNTLPPFPYDMFERDRERYPGFSTIQTSRGCPYGCTFCSQRSITGRSYRYVAAERALADIELLVEKYGAERIMLYEDNIGANKRRLDELLDGIINRGLNRKASFQTLIRGDHVDDGLLAHLKRANFSQLIFGLETASETLMRSINKGETVARVAEAIRKTAGYGIETAATLIFGLPGETAQDRRDAEQLVASLPLSSVRFNNLVPYPGTPIYDTLTKAGGILKKGEWENFATQYVWKGNDIPYVPDGTDRYELIYRILLANIRAYIRPKALWNLLTTQSAGSTAISLKKRWYLSSLLFRIARLGCYFLKRFIKVMFAMTVSKFRKETGV